MSWKLKTGTLKSLRNFIVESSVEPKTEFDLKMDEDIKSIFWHYKIEKDKFILIYDKEKDLCDVIKNGKHADLKKLTKSETERYREVLDIAIAYHHDRVEIDYLN